MEEAKRAISRKFVSKAVIDDKLDTNEQHNSVGNGEIEATADQTYDPRSLYEKLQEQKDIKETAFKEAKRFSNLIHRLDDEEYEFLKEINSQQQAKEDKKKEEEEKEINEFRKKTQESRMRAKENLGQLEKLTNMINGVSGDESNAKGIMKTSQGSNGNNKTKKRPLSLIDSLVPIRKKNTTADGRAGVKSDVDSKLSNGENESGGKRGSEEKGNNVNSLDLLCAYEESSDEE